MSCWRIVLAKLWSLGLELNVCSAREFVECTRVRVLGPIAAESPQEAALAALVRAVVERSGTAARASAAWAAYEDLQRKAGASFEMGLPSAF